MMCTNDVIDVSACTCETDLEITPEINLEYTLPEAQAGCIILGGAVGVEEVKVGVSGSGSPAHCGNNCTGTLNLAASGEITAEVCGPNSPKLTIALAGMYTGSSRYCLECNEETCRQECGTGSCDTNGGSVSGRLRLSNFYGYKNASTTSLYEFEVKCGATLFGEISGTIGGAITEDNSFCRPDECNECANLMASASLGIGGQLSCYISLKLTRPRYSKVIGCMNCASVRGDIYGGGELRDGECGSGGCAFAGVSAAASATSPCFSAGIGWFGVSAQCRASATGCAESNSCGSCTRCSGCSNISTNASCTIQVGSTTCN
jgi:hypothetical protein